MNEAQKKAKKKYKQKITRLTIDFYPTEKELVEQIKKQPKKQTYIKDLIRMDIAEAEIHQRIASEFGLPLKLFETKRRGK